MKTINEYIASEMGGKIVKHAKSPVVGLLVLAAGVALLVLMRTMAMGDSLQAMVLTVGVIATGVGIVLTAMCLTGAMSHYRYEPTHSTMRERKVYLDAGDFQLCRDALTGGDLAVMRALKPQTSTNAALHLLYSRDHAVALLQAGRFDTGHFEAETEVRVVTGTEFAAIEPLCK